MVEDFESVGGGDCDSGVSRVGVCLRELVNESEEDGADDSTGWGDSDSDRPERCERPVVGASNENCAGP